MEQNQTDDGRKQVRAKAYQQSQLQLGVLEEVCTILFLVVWVYLAAVVVDRLGLNNRYALLLVFGAILYFSYQAALFVLDYLGGYRLEHRYDLSTESLGQWLWRHTKAVVLWGVLLGVLVAGLYTAVWYVPYWAFWSWLAWMLLTVLLAQVFPVVILPLFYPSERLEDESLLERFRQLSEGTGISVEGVYRLELSKTTRKGNAMLAGLGRTRRVLLGDTILDKLGPEELDVVYTHELGHHVRRHFPKLLVVHALASGMLFALLYVLLDGFAGASGQAVAESIVRLPVVALVMSLFSFLLRPGLNAISRHFERQSDRYALERTGSAEPFIRAFDALAEQNLADPSPSRWVVIFYYDHPPIHERVAMARRWQEGERSAS
ncbi:MAG: M48 family metallopeptidase [Phycisphaerae bacterium]|nr:M48 family metallopeptidase [Phycisphaerae bacterium]